MFPFPPEDILELPMKARSLIPCGLRVGFCRARARQASGYTRNGRAITVWQAVV